MTDQLITIFIWCHRGGGGWLAQLSQNNKVVGFIHILEFSNHMEKNQAGAVKDTARDSN